MSTETPFHRRHLPHFYPPDAIYFITARLADPRIASLVAESIHYRDGKDYDLVAYTIMPNHMHIVYGIGQYDLLERPENAEALSGKQVSGIMMSLKRHTALQANKILDRTGSFWQDESYDHVVRDGEELARLIEYVLDNPVKAGFVDNRRDWQWSFSRFDL